MPVDPPARHYGLDWLRIGAFALLITYHVAMVFAPWDWVVKAPRTWPQLTAPMALLTPWRLPLLFAVSGFASRRMIARGAEGFAAERTRRLLLPVGFAIVLVLPPELWVRASERGYHDGVLRFWVADYWRAVPVWEHLWFVVYLWAYTMVLAAVLRWRGVAPIDRAAAWLKEGSRLLWAPVAALVAAKLALLFVVPEQQGLLRDWSAHAEYLPLFLLGFALGGPALPLAALARWRWPAALVAAAAGAVVVWVELTWPGRAVPPHAVMAMDRAVRIAMAWSTVLLLLHLADRWWNRDGRWRALLAEAVFPAYILHQPVLVVLAWTVLPRISDPVAGFALLLAATSAACALFYVAGREIGWLRPWIGLSPVARRAASAREPATI